MSEYKVMFSCFMCGDKFQMGPHTYKGKFISSYKISVCENCYKGNWDGWTLHYEERLLPHLKENGIPIPERNEKGWVPRE